jgi:hypothetical protein
MPKIRFRYWRLDEGAACHGIRLAHEALAGAQ